MSKGQFFCFLADVLKQSGKEPLKLWFLNHFCSLLHDVAAEMLVIAVEGRRCCETGTLKGMKKGGHSPSLHSDHKEA